MAKGKGGNKPVATVTQTKNSNTGASTRTVTPVNGATQAQANKAVAKGAQPKTLRNPNQDKNHWSNADYGQRFGRGDIRRLQDQGFNTNQVMKIAQMAYAGGSGNINKINKTNQALYDMSANAMKVGQNRMMRQGQESTNYYLPGKAMAIGQAGSKKQLGWNGFGDSMSINRYTGGDSYTQTGVWSLPSAYRTGGGGATGGNTTGGGTTAGGAGTGAGEVLPVDYIPPVEEPVTQPEMPGMMSGGGAGINSAMGIRRKKSSAKQSGASTRGTNQFNRGLSINSFNV